MSQLVGGIGSVTGFVSNPLVGSACVPAGAALLTAAAGRGLAGLGRLTLCCSTYHSLTLLIQAREQYHSKRGSLTSAEPPAAAAEEAVAAAAAAAVEAAAEETAHVAADPASTAVSASSSSSCHTRHHPSPSWINPPSAHTNPWLHYGGQQYMQFATRRRSASPAAAAMDPRSAVAAVAGREVSSHTWSQGQLLNALRQIGLEQPTAMAVQQAWQSGLHSRIPAYQQPRLRPFRHRHQESPLRLLARVRRLIRLHQAAAAEGSAPQAAAAADADLNLSRAASSKEQQFCDGVAAVVPSWGQLDIQEVLQRHPGLLLVPPTQLAASLNEILRGVSETLPAQSALQFVEQTNDLTLRIVNPVTSGDRMSGLYEAYVRILGVPPKPKVLENATSSYQRFRVESIAARLQELCNRFGQSVTHSLVSLQPHLLSSSVDSLLTNTKVLQEMLGLKEHELQNFLIRAPRLLTTRPDRLRSNLALLYQQLISIGLTPKQTSALLLKCPALLSLSSVNINAKVQGIKELLGPFDSRLGYVIRYQPSILGNSFEALNQKMDAIQTLLGTDREFVCSLVARSPSVLTLNTTTWDSRIQAHCKVLGITRPQLLKVLKADTQILTLQPENLQRKLDHICQVMGWRMPELQQAVARNPRVLLYDPALVTDYMQFITKLVSVSHLWVHSHPRRRSSTDQPTNTITEPVRSSGHVSDGNQGTSGLDLNLDWNVKGQISLLAAKSKRKKKKPPETRAPCWQVYYSRSISERLPLRLEYLMSIGLQEQVPLIIALRSTSVAWDEKYPDFANWAQLRLQALKVDPAEWPESLVKKATAAASKVVAAAAAAGYDQGFAAAAGLAYSGRLSGSGQQQQQQYAKPWSRAKARKAAAEVQQQQQQGIGTTVEHRRRCRSTTAAAVIVAEEKAAAAVLAAVDRTVGSSSSSNGGRRRRLQSSIRGYQSVSSPAAAAAHAAEAVSAAVDWDTVSSSSSSNGVCRRRSQSSAMGDQSVPSPAAAAVDVQTRPQAEAEASQQQRRESPSCSEGAFAVAGSASLLQQQQQQSMQQSVQLEMQPRVLQDASTASSARQVGFDHLGHQAAAGMAWLSASAEPQQQLYQQQCILASRMADAGDQQCAWQQQQQHGISDHISSSSSSNSSSSCDSSSSWQYTHPQWDAAAACYSSSSSSSSSPCLDVLLPRWAALQEAGYWAACKFSHSSNNSSSSREEHLLSLSELLRQRSQQLALGRVGWQAIAACG